MDKHTNMEKPCCDRSGDVRGMCFTCVGDLESMTLKQLTKLRTCPNLRYAMAWWFYNNHDLSTINRPDSVTLSKFLKANPELAKYIDILLYSAGITRCEVTNTIYMSIEKDDSDSDADSDNECETCGSTKHVTSKSYGAIQFAQCKGCWLNEDSDSD